MGLGVLADHNISAVVDDVVAEHGAVREELIPILIDVNRRLGFVPGPAIDQISSMLKVPKSNIFGVISFYELLSSEPRGRHIIQFCESAPCHVAGGRQVWQRLLDEVDLEPGQTSQDGKWTLLTTSCLGVCGVGPVLIIDEDMYGNVQPGRIPEILAKYE